MDSALLAKDVLSRIRSVVGSERSFVGLHEPCFNGNEWKYVKECIDTGWVSTAGSYVTRFEEDIQKLTGAKFVVATMNGTAALHLAFLASGIQEADEVLVPTLTFAATTNAIHYCQAMPHFVDVSEDHLGVDEQKIENYLEEIAEVRDGVCYNSRTGRVIRALVPVHIFGHPLNIESLVRLCNKYCIKLIEDAAEGVGSFFKGQHVGTFGDFGVLSFNGNKIATSGAGGAVLINDDEIAERVRHMATTGKRPHAWEYFHDIVAFNYRLPNLNAALGCAQLEQLPDFISAKYKLQKRYQEAFNDFTAGRIFAPAIEQQTSKSNYWLVALVLNEDNEEIRNQILNLGVEEKIQVRPVWSLLHKMPANMKCQKMDLSMAESLEKRLINLPSSAFLSEGVT